MRRPRQGFAAGKVSFPLALTALLHAVIDGFAAFLLRATLFVAFPAGFFGGHQIEKAAASTGVTGRCPVSVLQTLLPFLVPLPFPLPFP